MAWDLPLEGKSDQERFEALNWGLRTWDHWYFNDIDPRFGDSWPGQIPAQLVGHSLFYFTQEGGLVFDPMAGGGVVADTCLAFNRKCWSFDRPIDLKQGRRSSLTSGTRKACCGRSRERKNQTFSSLIHLILTNWQTNTQRTVSQVFPARNICDSLESFSL